ncbi:MAG: hypothetical protein CMG64_04435 [Candidatus Marinimicrobia bacterium]|nr:hypothetical protein [Candidatus Neomarinimicrobiota bacterium]|tara:strand:+ start:10254 stop:12113 length:1860 start_codon:yes stop_codon:yes gene_type:complete
MLSRYLKSVSELSRMQKQLILIFVDILNLYFSLYIAAIFRYDTFFPLDNILQYNFSFIIFAVPIIIIPIFVTNGLYRAVLRHIGIKTMFAIVYSITLATIISSILVVIIYGKFIVFGFLGINWFISILSTFAIRFIAHWFLYSLSKNSNLIPVAIFGSGDAGVMLAESIQESQKYVLKAMIDDDSKKVNTVVKSVKIYSTSDISALIKKAGVKIILLAIPSIGKSHRKKILNQLSKFPVKVMELPSVENIIDGKVTVNDIKKVDVEDILGRPSIKPIDELLSKNITNKNIFISGAGGSIGSELCRQILSLNPKKIVLYEISEFNLYSIHKELIGINKNIEIIPILGSVNHNSKIDVTLKENNIHTVYHAAAYKHVPMVEINPCSGVYNNILGTYNMVKQSINNNVETFILISTDKAVRPTNIMGASKRFSELILQAFNDQSNTVLSMVRFGNVLDSAGSVLPLFRKQINEGGPLTVTHQDIIRYFMSIPEAVQLVIQAGAMADGGEVFILDMGEPVNILDMAKKMIYLSGFVPKDDSNPDGDIPIEITGLRPGEKLYEELLIGEDSIVTYHPRIMKANESKISNQLVLEGLEEFKNACKEQDASKVKELLIRYVDEFNC